jgi:hypothetical protein
MRLRICLALLIFLSACATSAPSSREPVAQNLRIANLQRAAALPWTGNSASGKEGMRTTVCKAIIIRSSFFPSKVQRGVIYVGRVRALCTCTDSCEVPNLCQVLVCACPSCTA